MLETCRVTSPLELPAITHVDGSARLQTVDVASNRRFALLLRAFHVRTGCPILLNTSFNMRGQPIVCTAVDALVCFLQSRLDCLVLEDFLIDSAAVPEFLVSLVRARRSGRGSHDIDHSLHIPVTLPT